jgi:hypothetical protein
MFEKHTNVEIRLMQWRDVRKHASSEADVLSAFSEIKPRYRYIDYYNPQDWYNPFELLEHGCFCTTGISILLYHTLANLSYIDTERVDWKVISNHVTGHEGAVFSYNNYFYNVVPGKKIREYELVEHATIMTELGPIKIDLI